VHLVLQADLQVIVKVLADAGQVLDDRNGMRLKQRSRSDARELENLG
jgi:hypothetical protein